MITTLVARPQVCNMSTPHLVREFTDIKCAGARGEMSTPERHRRLTEVVAELRLRGVLD